MKMKTFTLYLLILSPFVITAQSFVAPPPLLPNPAHNQINQPVYYPETNVNNLNPAAKTHVVKKGENLYRIAQLYKVGVEDIKAWNNLNSDLLNAGMNLSIGSPSPYTSNSVPAPYDQMNPRSVPGWLNGTQNHTLLAGESLASIAQFYGLTEERLRLMNNLGPQATVPPGYVLNVNPCVNAPLGNTTIPPSYEQLNSSVNTMGNTQDYRSPVPKYFPPQDRFSNSSNLNNNPYNATSNNGAFNTKAFDDPNLPNSYNYNNAPSNNSFKREDQYDPNPMNSNAIPNNYEYTARGTAPIGSTNNTNPIIENGRKVHVTSSNDTLETIADYYKIPPDRLRVLNNMGLYDVVWPNQKLYLE